MPKEGVFTDDLREDLIKKKCDIIIHSWKDLPLDVGNKTEIIITLNRADERDLLFIKKNRIAKINIITGKGMRSISTKDPYKSSDLSILKHSIPEFISSNADLMKLIKDIQNVEEKNSGSFDVFLKSKNKFR